MGVRRVEGIVPAPRGVQLDILRDELVQVADLLLDLRDGGATYRPYPRRPRCFARSSRLRRRRFLRQSGERFGCLHRLDPLYFGEIVERAEQTAADRPE